MICVTIVFNDEDLAPEPFWLPVLPPVGSSINFPEGYLKYKDGKPCDEESWVIMGIVTQMVHPNTINPSAHAKPLVGKIIITVR